jgi:hypothetical protein
VLWIQRLRQVEDSFGVILAVKYNSRHSGEILKIEWIEGAFGVEMASWEQ